jgi:hypothetical protein
VVYIIAPNLVVYNCLGIFQTFEEDLNKMLDCSSPLPSNFTHIAEAPVQAIVINKTYKYMNG